MKPLFPSSFRRLLALSTSLAFGLSGVSASSGCSGERVGPASAASLGLAPWEGRDRELFGDEVDPSALGMLPPTSPRKDERLWARSRQADIIGRARVKTVTVETRDGQAMFHLGIQFASPLLVESKLTEREFELDVRPGSPAYGIVKAQDTGLQGKTFVGFLKRFAGTGDEVENHFYLAADSADIAAVVQEAIALEDVGSAGAPKP